MLKTGEIVRQVALITILAAFLEMLLPERKMTRYIRLVLGLFIVVAILSPLVEWLPFDSGLDVAAWDLRLEGAEASALQQGLEMADDNQKAALQIYSDRLARQIKALVVLTPGVETAEVVAEVAAEQGCRGTIKRVAIVVGLQEAEKEEGRQISTEIEEVLVAPEMATEKKIKVYEDGESAGNNEVDARGQGELTIDPSGEKFIPQGEPPSKNEKTAAEKAKFTAVQIQEIKNKIITTITHFYSLDPQRIEIQVLPQ